MFCKNCGVEIPDDANHCPECGAEVIKKESFFQKNKKVLIGCCVGLLVIFLLVAIFTSGDNHSNREGFNLNESEFKDACKLIDFDKLNKNPDKYKDEMLYGTGKIIQIMEDSNGGVMRVALDGDYDKVIFVNYLGSNDFVEDDYVTVYGYCDGSYTYTSTIGASVTLPRIDAMYLEKA